MVTPDQTATTVDADLIIACGVGDCLDWLARCAWHPLSDRETKLFVEVLSLPPNSLTALWQELTQGNKQGVVTLACIRRFDLPWSNDAACFIALLCENPAEITLYVTYLVWIAHRRGWPEMNLSTLSHLLNKGRFAWTDLKEAWGAQQCVAAPNGNALDAPAFIAYINALKRKR